MQASSVRSALHTANNTQATTALVLAILGLVCCGPLSIVGAVMARSEMRSIDRGEIHARHRGTAQAGFVIGIIGGILWACFFSLWMLGILLASATAP